MPCMFWFLCVHCVMSLKLVVWCFLVESMIIGSHLNHHLYVKVGVLENKKFCELNAFCLLRQN
jgi:hypothetical protein